MKKLELSQLEETTGGGCGWAVAGVISSSWGMVLAIATAATPIGWIGVGLSIIGYASSVDGAKHC